LQAASDVCWSYGYRTEMHKNAFIHSVVETNKQTNKQTNIRTYKDNINNMIIP